MVCFGISYHSVCKFPYVILYLSDDVAEVLFRNRNSVRTSPSVSWWWSLWLLSFLPVFVVNYPLIFSSIHSYFVDHVCTVSAINQVSQNYMLRCVHCKWQFCMCLLPLSPWNSTSTVFCNVVQKNHSLSYSFGHRSTNSGRQVARRVNFSWWHLIFS
jgi:hypothetical protein